MSALRFPAAALPEGATMEVWGDNTAWVISADGRQRMRLRDWAARRSVVVPDQALPGDESVGAIRDAAQGPPRLLSPQARELALRARAGQAGWSRPS